MISKKIKKTILSCLVILSFNTGQAQDVDASKPTNLYTQVNALFEFQSHPNHDVFGTRINVQYAFNPDNLLLIELPLLYHNKTDKFGLSDMRFRYYKAIKRNITKRFIAIAPYADVSAPTGKFSHGLGSSFWSLSVGVVGGFILSPKIAIFPGIGYVRLTEPEDYIGEAKNGVNIQTNMSISFSKKAFLFVNPILTLFDEANWSSEFNFNYVLKPNKLKVNIGYYPNFTNEIHTLRIGGTIFL